MAPRRRQRTSAGPVTLRKRVPRGELLLEIGVEELPYHFMAPALETLRHATGLALKDARLAHGTARTVGTPRRLTVVVRDVMSRQESVSKEVLGPPKGMAFDANGTPTMAALKFAQSQGVDVAALQSRSTPKGDYVCAVKHESGLPALTVLADLLPGLVQKLSFPKSMRWNDSGFRFGRPIRWLLAVYGGKPVHFSVGGVSSGVRTYGHRFLGPGKPSKRHGFAVVDFTSYLKQLERHGVIVDQDRRRTMITHQLNRLAKSARGQLHRDESLLDQAVFAVECPETILGKFNPQYLSLPQEVLITAMKEHQGYFSLMRSDGTLVPGFLAVTNMTLPDMSLIRQGNERVLAARLADAKFFFEEDRRTRLSDRVGRLRQVIFHRKLGTVYQKMERLRELAGSLAAEMALPPESIAACRRAAELCKVDLLTGMVGEFPTLQGIMGGEYAQHDGESLEVSHAIAEHYLPPSMEGPLPASVGGKVLSLADRMDTVTAFFHVGIIPTGSEDPFALRRHAAAIVRILAEGNVRVNLRAAIAQARSLLTDQGVGAVSKPGQPGGAGSVPDPLDFIGERLRYYGRTVHGLRDDLMSAVLARADRDTFDVVDLLARMKALQGIADRPEFEPLMVGFTRAHRLVEKERWVHAEVDATRFEHPSEHALQKSLEEAAQIVPARLADGAYPEALDALVNLKPAIDSFFTGVMVNAEDPAVRANRLSLLGEVDRLFLAYGDFSLVTARG